MNNTILEELEDDFGWGDDLPPVTKKKRGRPKKKRHDTPPVVTREEIDQAMQEFLSNGGSVKKTCSEQKQLLDDWYGANSAVT